MSEDVELLPCAHCGDLHARYKNDDSSPEWTLWYAQCGWCGIRTPLCANRLAASKFWNRRSNRTRDSQSDAKPVPYRAEQRAKR